MSSNPLLGAGVDSLIKHLSCAPHLERLVLWGVKMTPQQVMDLTTAVPQHGNITKLWSDYHDHKGNPNPEHEWPSKYFWKRRYPHLFSKSSPESAHEQEQADSSCESSLSSGSSSESEMTQEQNDEEVIETEDETISYESEEDQEQEMGNQTAESQVLSTDEDEKGNLKLEDVGSSAGSDDPQEQEEEGIAESEDETSLPTSGENQQQGDEEYTRPSEEGHQNPSGEERLSRAPSSKTVRKTASRTCVII